MALQKLCTYICPRGMLHLCNPPKISAHAYNGRDTLADRVNTYNDNILTRQCVSCTSSYWKTYAVARHVSSVMSGKDTPTNASLRMLRLKKNSMFSSGSSAGSSADLTTASLAVMSRGERVYTPPTQNYGAAVQRRREHNTCRQKHTRHGTINNDDK